MRPLSYSELEAMGLLNTQVPDLEENKQEQGDLTGLQANLPLWARQQHFKATPFTSPPCGFGI